VRALEHAAMSGRVRAGDGLATQRIGPATRLRVVDALLTGTHEPGTSHYELLRAFTDDATLRHVDRELAARDYHTHEFGDSLLIERNIVGATCLITDRLGYPTLGLSCLGTALAR
jgi:S-adenosylmethionine:tRNA ribosyltransferase-isomerase